jgi:hypothetical protein
MKLVNVDLKVLIRRQSDSFDGRGFCERAQTGNWNRRLDSEDFAEAIGKVFQVKNVLIVHVLSYIIHSSMSWLQNLLLCFSSDLFENIRL